MRIALGLVFVGCAAQPARQREHAPDEQASSPFAYGYYLRAEMESVLTADQKTRLKDAKEHHGRRGPGRPMGGDRAGPPPGK